MDLAVEQLELVSVEMMDSEEVQQELEWSSGDGRNRQVPLGTCAVLEVVVDFRYLEQDALLIRPGCVEQITWVEIVRDTEFAKCCEGQLAIRFCVCLVQIGKIDQLRVKMIAQGA
jgi:hypothetical protein